MFDKKATFDQLNLVFRRILNQELFSYPSLKIPRYFLKCLCLRNLKRLKSVSKSEFYLKKGVKKLQKDMDVVAIVRMLHNVDIMHSVLFDEFSQFLLKFQRRLVIDSELGSSSENDRQRTRRLQREILSANGSIGDKLLDADYKRQVFKNLLQTKFKEMLK